MPHNCKSGRKELGSRGKDTKISGEYKRTTFLVFMEDSYESCAILSAMADPGFPRRGGGGCQSLRLWQKPIIWQYFAENCIVVLIVQTLALSITKSRPLYKTVYRYP